MGTLPDISVSKRNILGIPRSQNTLGLKTLAWIELHYIHIRIQIIDCAVLQRLDMFIVVHILIDSYTMHIEFFFLLCVLLSRGKLIIMGIQNIVSFFRNDIHVYVFRIINIIVGSKGNITRSKSFHFELNIFI